MLNQCSETPENFASQELVSSPVDSGTKINAVRETFNADGGIRSQTQGLLCCLGFHLQFSQASGVRSGIFLVLLDELLGKVVDKNLVQLRTAQFILVHRRKDSVHATARGNDGNVRPRTTKVRHNDKLILYSRLSTGIVSQERSNWLVNELNDIEISVLGRSFQSVALSVSEVGWDCDDSGIDVLSKKVGCRLSETAQMAGSDFGDGDSAGLFAGGIADGEGNGGIMSLRVRGRVAWGWVYGLETVKESQQMCLTDNGFEVLLLLAEEIFEVCDCVVCVSDQLGLCLGSVVFFTINIRQYRWDMAVFMTSQQSVNGIGLIIRQYEPPSSLAITSAFPSYSDLIKPVSRIPSIDTIRGANIATHRGGVGDRAVRVTKGNTNGIALGGFGRNPVRFFAHSVCRFQKKQLKRRKMGIQGGRFVPGCCARSRHLVQHEETSRNFSDPDKTLIGPGKTFLRRLSISLSKRGETRQNIC